MKNPTTETFGPIAIQDKKGGELRVACKSSPSPGRHLRCFFLSAGSCTHGQAAERRLADPDNTPDWCEMRADAVKDAMASLSGDR